MTEAEQEQKKKAAVELANAYREMMGTFAWRHLKGVVIPRIVSDIQGNVDSLDIDKLTVAHVAEARGTRKAFEHVDAEINWILDGHEVITRK